MQQKVCTMSSGNAVFITRPDAAAARCLSRVGHCDAFQITVLIICWVHGRMFFVCSEENLDLPRYHLNLT